VANAFLSDIACEGAVVGQPVLGGHGYIREWGQDQFVRDIRITQSYEGTNGVQARDLVGRKTVSCKGALLNEFLSEVDNYLVQNSAKLSQLSILKNFRESVAVLRTATENIITQTEKSDSSMGAVAADYLHLVGHVCVAYMWLQMMCAAQSSANPSAASKGVTGQFYFDRLLPKIHGLARSIEGGASALSQMQEHMW
jgi:hypothetical protein